MTGNYQCEGFTTIKTIERRENRERGTCRYRLLVPVVPKLYSTNCASNVVPFIEWSGVCG